MNHSPVEMQPSASTETSLNNALDDDEVSFVALASIVLKGRRLIVGTALLVFAATVLVLLSREKTFEALSQFKPQGAEDAVSGLAGIAAQFGISSAGSGTDDSPAFYEALLSSRELLLAAAYTEYHFAMETGGRDSISGTLVDIYEIEAESPEEERIGIVNFLRQFVSAESSRGTGLVTLRTSALWPGLAEQINRRLLDLLNDFNLGRRQTRAAAERQFVENRREQARAELEGAEAELGQFLDRNRRIGESSQLSFELGRLQRRVDLRQQVYTSLAQAYEQARIEEVRNIPVITIIDGPEGSSVPVGRRRRTIALIALLLGGGLGIVLAFVREYLTRRRASDPAEYAEFHQSWSAVLDDLRMITKWPGRRRGPERSKDRTSQM